MPILKKVISHQSSVIRENSKHANAQGLKAKPAFTLIELLVVIAIIGILAALATTSYSDSQKKSRDSRRKSDLSAIQKALELVKQDSPGNYSYPYPLAVALSATNTTPLISSSYIKAIPTDPKTGAGYRYVPLTSTPAACAAAGACVTYSLVACLENLKDPQKDSPNINPPCDGTTTTSYTITNL